MRSRPPALSCVAIAALVATGASVGSAAGLLGHRTLAVSQHRDKPYHYQWHDASGPVVRFNQPLRQGIDLTLEASHLTSTFEYVHDGDEIYRKFSVRDLILGGTYHAPVGSSRGFLAAGVGMTRFQFDEDGVNEIVYTIAAGLEMPLGSRFTLTPLVRWTDSFDNGSFGEGIFLGLWEFVVIAELELSDRWSTLVHLEFDDDAGWGLSAGLAVRF